MDEATANALRERARTIWGLGEYERVQERLLPAAEALVDAAGVAAGQQALDVAAGTGNVAIAAARRGATVTATDLSPVMVEKGRARTEDLDVRWLEADAENLPFEDSSFDCSLSAFGAMFAPRQERVAAELLRVVRRGGRAAMTAWVPEGVQADAAALLAQQFPNSPAPMMNEWGKEDVARARFAAAGAAAVAIERRALHWEFESPQAWLEFMERGAPPVVAARAALGEERWEELRKELLATLPEAHGPLTIEPAYLVILARRA